MHAEKRKSENGTLKLKRKVYEKELHKLHPTLSPLAACKIIGVLPNYRFG
jgi:hypothetical protein